MKDLLKQKFDETPRSLFDTQQPDEARLWQGIEAQLSETKPGGFGWRHLYAAAAVIVLLVMAGGLYVNRPVPPSQALQMTANPIATVPAQQAETALPPQAAQAFQAKGGAQAVAQTEYSEEGILLENDFSQLLTQLQDQYEYLRQQLAEGDQPDAVMDSMAQNLELQMRVLSSQMQVLEQIRYAREAQAGPRGKPL